MNESKKQTRGRQARVPTNGTLRHRIMTPSVEGVPEPCPACQPFVKVLQTHYMERCKDIQKASRSLDKKIADYLKWFPHYYEKRAGTSTSRSLVAVLNLALQIASSSREALAIQECLKLFNQTASQQGCPQRSATKKKLSSKRNGGKPRVAQTQ